MSFKFNFQAAGSTPASVPSAGGHIQEIEAEEVIYSTATKVEVATCFQCFLLFSVGLMQFLSLPTIDHICALHAFPKTTTICDILQDAAERNIEDVVLTRHVSLKKVCAIATCDPLYATCQCLMLSSTATKGDLRHVADLRQKRGGVGLMQTMAVVW